MKCLFTLLVKLSLGSCAAVVEDVRAKKSCLACSAVEIGLLGAGEGLYDNDGVVMDVVDATVVW